MSQSKKPVSMALGAVVATGTLLAGSMFSMQAMAQGYMQDAGAKTTTAEGKCGEGKCGSGDAAKASEGKCGEGKGGGAAKKANAAKAGHEGSCGMAMMDTDKDGRLSRAEFNAAHKSREEKFASHDANGDGFISQAEMDAHHAEMKKAKPADKAKAEGKCGEGKCGEGKCGSKS